MFKVLQLEVLDFKTKSKSNKIFKTFICYENKYGLLEPHILSKYIEINFGLYEINTQKKYAEEIKKFLNFLLSNKSINTLKDLNLEHGSEYLKFLSEKVTRGEIKSSSFHYAEKRLIHFYEWLVLNEIIQEKIIFSKSDIHKSLYKRRMTNSPFARLDLGVPRPSNRSIQTIDRLHDFGNNREKYIIEFLNLIELIEPYILLGVILQIYGGLRMGEVLNLTTSDIFITEDWSSQPSKVLIVDNWRKLDGFPMGLDMQVKREREQLILATDLLKNAYKKHLSKLDKIKKNYSGPLIVSLKNGKKISGQSYRNKFNKVRDLFIKIIEKRDDSKEFYYFITSKKWSTHICRGIYTNMLKNDLNLSDSEIRVLRGDISEQSLKAYLEKSNAIYKINEGIELLNKKLGS